MNIDTRQYMVHPGEVTDLSERETRYEGDISKQDAKKTLEEYQKEIEEQIQVLHAGRKKSLLIVLQAMDAGGKDSTVRRVFGPVNPNWCKPHSFREPSVTELAHDFLWRIHKAVPPRGYLGIFNRSHYEDVIIVKVKGLAPEATIEERYAHINGFEKLLHDEGTAIVKFYLHISKEYQKKRLERRLHRPDKFWKFDPQDLKERERWDAYREAYNTALTRCSTWYAPWYVIPAERRWYRDLVIARIVLDTLKGMDLKYPEADFDPEKMKVK